MAIFDLAPDSDILVTLLRPSEGKIEPDEYGAYLNYYEDTWVALRESEEGKFLGLVGHDDVRIVVENITNQVLSGSGCQRQNLRSELSRDSRFQFQHADKGTLNGIIDLALRLWLTLNIRDRKFAFATHSIQWDDDTSLQAFVAKQFPEPRLQRELGEKMFDFVLPDDFTVVKLRRYSGVKVDWTTSLNEHLDWDRKHRTLKIYPLKSYMRQLRRSEVEIIPNIVIDEYLTTINFLFPCWDIKTQEYLKRKQQTFRLEGPVGYPGPLHLSDFHFFRDRLSTLYTEFISPPPSMTHLFNDRRNVLAWYTFWFAVLVVVLTIVFGMISSVTACLQTRYAYEALLLAMESAAFGDACPPVTCSPS